MTFLIPRKAIYSGLPINTISNTNSDDQVPLAAQEDEPAARYASVSVQTPRKLTTRFKESWQGQVEISSPKSTCSVSKIASKGIERKGTARVLLLCSLIIIPMAFLSTCLLLLVFCNKISNPKSDTNSLLVNYKASRLTTLTLVMSTVSTWLVSPAMLLLRYHLAKQYMNASISSSESSKLPTPYQLSILVALLAAQVSSLWDWLKYKTWRRQRSSIIAPQISISAGMLLLLLLLSTSMSLTDSWFHLTTQSINFSQVKNVSTPIHQYGRDITATCTNGYYDGSGPTTSDIGVNYEYPNGTEKHVYLPCSLLPLDDFVQITNATEAFSTVNNISLTNSVTMVTSEAQSYALLTQAKPLPNIDFSASTFAASTQCTSIVMQCFQAASSVSATFHCPAGNFSGTISTSDKRRRQEYPAESPKQWTVGYVDPNTNTTTIDSLDFIRYPDLSNYTWILIADMFDPVIASEPTLFALACNTSIWNVTYNVIDGEYNLTSKVLSNRLTALSLSGPITNTLDIQLSSPSTTLEARFSQIALSNSSTESITSQFADEYSTVAIAFTAGIVTPIPNLKESLRVTSLVTQLSPAPLFILVTLAAIYVVAGMILAIIALFSCRNGVDSAQDMLSLSGITAAAFEQGSVHTEESVESVRDIYEEMATNGKFTSRICIEKVPEGYWRFRSLDRLSKEGQKV